MDLNTVLEYGKIIVMLVLGGLSLYFKYSTKAQTKAKKVQEKIAEITANAVILIKQAEADYKDVTKAGGQKFNQVVDQLYSLVPDGFNRIITRDMIEEIVQSAFDQIEEYAKLKLDNAVGE